MARQIRRVGPFVLVTTLLIALAALLAPTPPPVQAATFTSPFWTNTSPQVECAGCACPPCPRPSLWSKELVNWLTAEASQAIDITGSKGLVSDFTIALSWRSYRDGMTQVGNGWILSFEHTVETEVLNESDPDSPGGHEVYWRRPDGLVVTYEWDGMSYSTDDCSVRHVLTRNSPYKLTDPKGNQMLFDTNGMPDKYTDANGNVIDLTYNSSLQVTGVTDTRGRHFSFSHNPDGFLQDIDSPCGDRWTLGYDSSGNLVTVDTPTTTQHPSGTRTTFSYDGSNRITAVQDGRGNTTHQYAYVGSTGEVDKVAVSGNDVEYTTAAGRTERTDRNGVVHRAHHSGKNITKTDKYVDGQSKYATTYTYSGSDLVKAVMPRGNRIDYTWNSNGELTERRHKTADTPSTSPTDIVYSWTYSNGFVTSYTGPEAGLTTYTRDSNGNATKITYPAVTSPQMQVADKQFQYNSAGQITKITDEEGIVTNYYYSTSGSDYGLLTKVEVDPTGLDLETTLTYDCDGNVQAIQDPLQQTTSFTWDALGRLIEKTTPTPLSIKTTYEYDENGNLTKTEVQNKDKDGASVTANPWITTSSTFTNENQVATIEEEIDASTTRTVSMTYDGEGSRIRVTQPEGNKLAWTYNERGLVASHTRGEGDAAASTVSFAYDDNGNLTTVTDGRGNATTHTYDLFDRRTKTTDPLGNYVEITLNKLSRVEGKAWKSSAGAVLARRSFSIDERGRTWQTSDLREDPSTTHSDAVTEIERYKTGHVKTITDALGNATTFGYDAAWRRTSITDAMGNSTTWTVNAIGRPTAWSIVEIDGTSSVTHEFEATYDSLGRRTTLTEIDRTNGNNKLVTTYGRDSRGNLVWLVNPKGDPTRWTYDAAGRMTKKEVALATGTTLEDFTSALEQDWEMDGNNRLTSFTDDAGNTTTTTWDALDRRTVLTYDNLDSVAFVYDANNNITKLTDAAGNVREDTFDKNNRRTSRTVTRATGFLGTTSETFAYDGIGRITSAEDDDYKVEYTYATLGLSSRVYEEKHSYVGGSAYTKTVKKTHDAVGNKVTELYPSGLDLDYTWNAISALSTVTDGTSTIASFSYVGMRRKQIAFESGSTASYTYTGFRREIERIHHETSTSGSILDLQYGYDANHDRQYERLGGTSATGDAFAYDYARRLTTAWMGSTDVTSPSTSSYSNKIEYTLDDDGNRTAVKVTPYGQGSTTTNYTANNLNQYTNVGGASQVHDKNGNLTDDGNQKYEYDYKNQLVRVKQGSTTIAEYKYDAFGRRVEKDDQTTVQRYIYSGAHTISVYDGSDTWLQDFVFGTDVDDILMLEQADVLDYDSDADTTESTRSFYHRNALGSVMEITDMNQAAVVSYRYNPYGSVSISRGGSPQSTDPLGNPWMYTGRHHDEETGLDYYRARYYSSATGRFLQRDPLEHVDGPSLYEYVGSSVVNRTDPLGLSWVYEHALTGGYTQSYIEDKKFYCMKKGITKALCKCKEFTLRAAWTTTFKWSCTLYQWYEDGEMEVNGVIRDIGEMFSEIPELPLQIAAPVEGIRFVKSGGKAASLMATGMLAVIKGFGEALKFFGGTDTVATEDSEPTGQFDIKKNSSFSYERFMVTPTSKYVARAKCAGKPDCDEHGGHPTMPLGDDAKPSGDTENPDGWGENRQTNGASVTSGDGATMPDGCRSK